MTCAQSPASAYRTVANPNSTRMATLNTRGSVNQLISTRPLSQSNHRAFAPTHPEPPPTTGAHHLIDYILLHVSTQYDQPSRTTPTSLSGTLKIQPRIPLRLQDGDEASGIKNHRSTPAGGCGASGKSAAETTRHPVCAASFSILARAKEGESSMDDDPL